MGIIVTKFGGSSLANADRFKQVLSIMQALENRRCVVLSAPGVYKCKPKVTTLLSEAWQRYASHTNCSEYIEIIARRYDDIGRQLNVRGMKDQALQSIHSALTISEAHVLSRGEYLCARLFSEFSGVPMCDAALLLAFRQDGKLDLSLTLRQLADAIDSSVKMIIPGFYGADATGRIRTLPRNGSDITGALAAAACNAELYENWTDVSGMMTADPSIVPEAQSIPQISYRQMRKLAIAGAKVLHPDCLAPVEECGIPVRLCNTFHPNHPGTLICESDAPQISCLIMKNGPTITDTETTAISLFGAKPSMIADLRHMKGVISIKANEEPCVVIVPRGEAHAYARKLHSLLINNKELPLF